MYLSRHQIRVFRKPVADWTFLSAASLIGGMWMKLRGKTVDAVKLLICLCLRGLL